MLPPRRDEGPGVRVPVLMYHYIRVNPDPLDAYGADLSVSPAHFAAQMEFLVHDGFTTITPDALIAALDHGAPLPPRPVLLTFDDGYDDFYTAAYPVLQRLGLRATSFVITGRVGTPGYLTWDAMRAMQAGGLVQFEAHTVDHAEMAHIPLARAEYELGASKASLEAHLDTPVAYFCYPSGDYDPAVEDLLAAAGYRAAFTTQPGLWHHPGEAFALTRMRVHGADTLARFTAHLGLSAAPGPELPAPPDADPRPAEPHLVPR